MLQCVFLKVSAICCSSSASISFLKYFSEANFNSLNVPILGKPITDVCIIPSKYIFLISLIIIGVPHSEKYIKIRVVHSFKLWSALIFDCKITFLFPAHAFLLSLLSHKYPVRHCCIHCSGLLIPGFSLDTAFSLLPAGFSRQICPGHKSYSRASSLPWEWKQNRDSYR